jgi:hypothetical protein
MKQRESADAIVIAIAGADGKISVFSKMKNIRALRSSVPVEVSMRGLAIGPNPINISKNEN